MGMAAANEATRILRDRIELSVQWPSDTAWHRAVRENNEVHFVRNSGQVSFTSQQHRKTDAGVDECKLIDVNVERAGGPGLTSARRVVDIYGILCGLMAQLQVVSDATVASLLWAGDEDFTANATVKYRAAGSWDTGLDGKLVNDMLRLLVIDTRHDDIGAEGGRDFREPRLVGDDVDLSDSDFGLFVIAPDVLGHLSGFRLTEGAIAESVADYVVLLQEFSWAINEQQSDAQAA